MAIESKDGTPERANNRAQPLSNVLTQSEHVNDLMRQSAEDLSFAVSQIKKELALRGLSPAVEIALTNSAAAKSKLHDARERLTTVNIALANEIRDRTMVDYQLAAAIEQQESARNAAFHDVLTGLPNRALFNDRLEHSIAQARRYRWTLAVMFIDLDKFKEINDTYGHSAGDEVLQIIAMRLKQNTRDDDSVSRRSGDEFLYALTQIHERKDIVMIANKILNAIRAPCESTLFGSSAEASVQASMGIAVFPKDGDTADALIHRADEAMYRAKENKSGYEFAQ